MRYAKIRLTFIEGTVMVKILRYFGASDDDLKLLENSGSNLLNDPTLPFRKSRNGRLTPLRVTRRGLGAQPIKSI
ncbi:hypothetical protein MNBD_GAMMA01-2253 [hydrothermal vent metagenome]|uniref:Uncharacterized protein n=1 Tax=hydrothermal vent metagenome TaxID=652676 RepID=A0A3B0VRS3_9ZZZZ